MEKITVTLNLANATPMRQFDWMAYRDPEDASRYGYGATEREALDDLRRIEAEDLCDRECEAARQDGKGCALVGGCLCINERWRTARMPGWE